MMSGIPELHALLLTAPRGSVASGTPATGTPVRYQCPPRLSAAATTATLLLLPFLCYLELLTVSVNIYPDVFVERNATGVAGYA